MQYIIFICDIIFLPSDVEKHTVIAQTIAREARKRMSNKTYDNEIKIDTSLIPNHTRDSLAAATLDFVKGLKETPETNKMLDEKKKELGLQ